MTARVKTIYTKRIKIPDNMEKLILNALVLRPIQYSFYQSKSYYNTGQKT